MFINNAMAQATSVAPQATMQSTLGSIFMLVAFMAVFYFLVYKPQAAQAKKQKEIISSIKKGDVVVLASGIIGKVEKVYSEQMLFIEIADETIVRVERDKVAEILDKKHYVSLEKPSKPAKSVKDNAKSTKPAKNTTK